ncbi:PREDICTED: uncharacterized protein LOC105368481 [Ceratosolen solmsi marchali]|uniref:Uncharacterized protein LOC105368481 n=1 Tax=Ceratosolen solmsi marchali TaxID=326594 RepID=A0AAJ7E2U2_9HYME|nr:PREDICTED: uncharacterized protein LOC105368481 [Ceratosolen solmsi marchali]
MRENVKEFNNHSIWRACNKIRAAVSRIHINLWDYFTPLDTEQNNLISELEFITVLSGSLGKQVGLSNQEISELADYFRTQDGRIFYTQFCTIIQENSKNIIRNRDFCINMRWRKIFHGFLSLSEERKLEIIITKIASCINRQQILIRPYFHDYELISKNCGVVTFTHFARVLHFLDINLSPNEMYLLIKKFSKDNYSVNYVAFIQAIEEVQDFFEKNKANQDGMLLDKFPGRIISVNLPKLNRPEIGKIKTSCVFPQQLHFLSVDTRSKRIRNIEEIMLRLQEHAFKSQIRVADHFQDFDIFNVGKISENQFQRGLNAFRKSAHGNLYLAAEEIENIIAFYKDPSDIERICWRAFEDDVEQVFTKKHLDKQPNCKVVAPPVEVKKLNRLSYGEWDCSEIDSKLTSTVLMEKFYTRSLKKIMQCIEQRRFSLRQYFRDFDKINRGHVSGAQLRQVFTAATISLTREEILSLEFMYNDNLGFYYLDFISKLEQLLDESSICEKQQLKNKLDIFNLSEKCPAPEETDIDLILAKIKSKVVCNGIKVNEFIRHFDLRNEKIVTRLQFDRGLDQLKCDLTRTEVNSLMDHFIASQRPNYIDYSKFSDAVEGAMVKGQLEKSPLVIPIRHVPTKDTTRSFLNFDERQILTRGLNAISAYVDNNLEELFKDFDKSLNTGTVTKNELIRVLSIRNIIYNLNANEIDVLFKCFTTGHIKVEPKFDYRAFLNALYILRENNMIKT